MLALLGVAEVLAEQVILLVLVLFMEVAEMAEGLRHLHVEEPGEGMAGLMVRPAEKADVDMSGVTVALVAAVAEQVDIAEAFLAVVAAGIIPVIIPQRVLAALVVAAEEVLVPVAEAKVEAALEF